MWFIPAFLKQNRKPSSRLDGNDWLHCLDRVGVRLQEMTGETEGEFLQFGEKLQNMHSRTKTLSQLSTAAAERLTGEAVVSAMEGLRVFLERIGDFQDISHRGSVTLAAILNRLQEVRKRLEAFSQIVRTLRVLSPLIRIESARLGDKYEGFVSLGGEVQGLIRQVETGSSTLGKHLEDLSRFLEHHLSQIIHFEDTQQEQAARILERSSSSMSEMKRRYDLSCQAIKNAAGRWQQISGNIGEVVASLQFHDITRQRMEHVREALVALLHESQNPEADPQSEFPGVDGLHRLPGPKSEKGEGGSAPLPLVAATCTLQIAQLNNARQDLTAALSRLDENLHRIASEISSMSGDILSALGGSEEQDKTYFSELEESLTKMIAAVDAFTAMNRQLAQSMDKVALDLGNMAGFVRDIEKMGIVMRMTALNACIHAAHIGDGGLALGVLADSIHWLSLDTSESIDHIAGLMKVIGQEAATLVGFDGQVGQAEDSRSLVRQIESLIQPLREMDDELSGQLKQIGTEGTDLQKELEAMTAEFRVQGAIELGIEETVKTLTGLQDQLRLMLPEGTATGAVLEDLAARYTMNQEREIHLAVAASALPPAAEAPAASLEAEAARPPEGAQPPSTSEEDLGDNVELF